jgi:hypothetical protein
LAAVFDVFGDESGRGDCQRDFSRLNTLTFPYLVERQLLLDAGR